ncbi:MAG TPA: hypothetical protein VFJ69_07140 [Actinomycetota bacterium]|nr:hypothetical protein [Actinomycetota bacterium]
MAFEAVHRPPQLQHLFGGDGVRQALDPRPSFCDIEQPPRRI